MNKIFIKNNKNTGQEIVEIVKSMSPADKAKFYCKLIGCSGVRPECLNGDVNCDILKPFFINHTSKTTS